MDYLKIYKWNSGHVGIKLYNNDSKEYYALLPSNDRNLKYGNNNQNNNIFTRKINDIHESKSRRTPGFVNSYLDDQKNMLRPGHQSTDLYALKDCFGLINLIINKYRDEFDSTGFSKLERTFNLSFSQMSLRSFDENPFNEDLIANYNYSLSNIIPYKTKVSEEVLAIIEKIENLSIMYNEELYQSDSFSKVPPSRGSSILLSTNHYLKRVNESEFKVPNESLILRNKILELAETYKDKGIKLSNTDNKSKFIRYIIKKPTNTFSLPYGATDKWFGLNILSIKKGISEFHNRDNPIHHNHEIYYKEYSRYHNCIGYVRYLLEYGGINAFINSKELESFGITQPNKLDRYIERIMHVINHINSKANAIFNHNLQYLIANTNSNYLQNEGKYNEARNISTLIRKYNAENTNVFTTKKLSILLQIVNKLNVSNGSLAQRQFITDLAFEIKRLYSLS